MTAFTLCSPSLARRLTALAGAVAVAGLLAACGSDDTADGHSAHGDHAHTSATAAPTSVAPGVNSADVMFAQMMIPHHQQAVEMAKMVPDHTENGWLKDFAGQVIASQQPEIDQMTSALQSWGQSVPAGQDAHMDHDMGGGAMDGMMTSDQMDKLQTLTGDDFDKEWLTMMIAHHQGAVDMSKTELAQGENTQNAGAGAEDHRRPGSGDRGDAVTTRYVNAPMELARL
ncbi:DUF305 domain-containing protein [Gordonia sp. (in: high G+C Gram-positive bacteria)]|uniref:DUF305 domain-containing protein n=1 Tax=Gordonia sp. (in: high G+C Gram-positive bacteria) TaxID=84139 RepID=UPI0039E372CF